MRISYVFFFFLTGKVAKITKKKSRTFKVDKLKIVCYAECSLTIATALNNKKNSQMVKWRERTPFWRQYNLLFNTSGAFKTVLFVYRSFLFDFLSFTVVWSIWLSIILLWEAGIISVFEFFLWKHLTLWLSIIISEVHYIMHWYVGMW